MTRTTTTPDAPQALGCASANRPAGAAAWPAEARNAPARFPDWTKPDGDNRPRFVDAGDRGPKTQKFEERRYVYRQGDIPVRIKIIRGNGKGSLDVYRVVSDEGKTGWQSRRPGEFRAVPYFVHGTNPFDAEGVIYWTGDEHGAEIIARAGLPGFTFGGLRDGLPSGCEAFVRGRDVVIVAGSDKAGREHAEVKAALAARVANSVRVVNFPDDPESDGVAERLPQQAVSELLKTVAAASPWQSPGAEITDVSLVPAQTEGRLQLPTLPNRVPAIVEADHSDRCGRMCSFLTTSARRYQCRSRPGRLASHRGPSDFGAMSMGSAGELRGGQLEDQSGCSPDAPRWRSRGPGPPPCGQPKTSERGCVL